MKMTINDTVYGILGIDTYQTQLTIQDFDTGYGKIPYSLFSAKGDLLIGTGVGAADHLGVGADGYGLIADSTQPLGMRFGPISSGGNPLFINNTGVTQNMGTVCVHDNSLQQAFKVTARVGDASVCGVLKADCLANLYGPMYAYGEIGTVKVYNAVTAYHWLIASDQSGYAKDSGYIQRPLCPVGIALSANASGPGTVYCQFFTLPWSTSAILQQLPSVTTFYSASQTTPLTIAHTVDAGTDLLVVQVVGNNAGAITNITWNGTGLTLVAGFQGANGNTLSGWIRNPDVGTHSVVITLPATQPVGVIVTNYIGSLASPIRSSAASSTLSTTLASAVGDICRDIVRNSNAVTPGADQIATDLSGDGKYQASKKDGAAGTTTMSWTGTASYPTQAMLVLAGS